MEPFGPLLNFPSLVGYDFNGDGTAMGITPSLDRLGIEKDNRSVERVQYDF